MSHCFRNGTMYKRHQRNATGSCDRCGQEFGTSGYLAPQEDARDKVRGIAVEGLTDASESIAREGAVVSELPGAEGGV